MSRMLIYLAVMSPWRSSEGQNREAFTIPFLLRVGFT